MIKISSEQAKTVLAEASTVIREQIGTIQDLTTKLANFQKKDRCEKIAEDMEVKGVYPEFSFKEKLASLVAKEDTQLDKIEGALEFQPELSKVASLDDKTANAVDPLLKLRQFLDS